MTRNREKVFNSSMVASFSAFFSFGSAVCISVSNIFRLLLIGNPQMEDIYVLPIWFSVFHLFTVYSTLSISLLWIESASSVFRDLASQAYLVRTRKLMLLSALAYVSTVLILSMVTHCFGAVVCFNAFIMVIVAVLLLNGSKILSRQLAGEWTGQARFSEKGKNNSQSFTLKLRSTVKKPLKKYIRPRRVSISAIPVLQEVTEAAPNISKNAQKIIGCTRKIIGCANFVAVNSVVFCAACAGYTASSTYASLGVFAFVCSVFIILCPLMIQTAILLYLYGNSKQVQYLPQTRRKRKRYRGDNNAAGKAQAIAEHKCEEGKMSAEHKCEEGKKS